MDDAAFDVLGDAIAGSIMEGVEASMEDPAVLQALLEASSVAGE